MSIGTVGGCAGRSCPRSGRIPVLRRPRPLADPLVKLSQLVGQSVLTESVELIGFQFESQGGGEQVIGSTGNHDARCGVVAARGWRKYRPRWRKRWIRFCFRCLVGIESGRISRYTGNEIGLGRGLTQLLVGGTKLFFVRLSQDGPIEWTFELLPDFPDVVGKKWCQFEWRFGRIGGDVPGCCWRRSRIDRNLWRLSIGNTYDQCYGE